MSTFCVRHSRQFGERLEPTFSCFASVAWATDIFHGSVVLLCKIDIKDKLTLFIEKRTAVEPPENDEEGRMGKDRKRVR